MQRQRHGVLVNIVLPYIHRSFHFTSSPAKTASNVDLSPSPTYSTTTTTFYPHPTLDRGGLYPESSRAAQERSKFVQQTKWNVYNAGTRIKGTEKEKDEREEGRGWSTDDVCAWDSAVQGDVRKAPNQAAGNVVDEVEAGEKRQTVYDRTVDQALSKIIEIHSAPLRPASISSLSSPTASHPEIDIDIDTSPLETRTPPDTLSPSVEERQTPLSTRSSLSTSDAPIPPVISRLLQHRQFRLAVFYILNNPHLTSNRALVRRLADILEQRGAGKLAIRLRSSLDSWCDDSSPGTSFSTQKKPGRRRGDNAWLAGCPADTTPRWNGYWNMAHLPPVGDRPTCQTALTEYINTRLEFLLRKPSLTKRPFHPLESAKPAQRVPPTTDPLLETSNHALPGYNLPYPHPNLQQVRALLETISRLEKTQNFVPDRITANLIVRCWLRSAQPPHPLSDGWIYRGTREDGEEVYVKKMVSEKVMGPKELLMLFRVVSTVMERNVRDAERRMDKLAERHRSKEGDTDDQRQRSQVKLDVKDEGSEDSEMIEWRLHVKPFAELVLGGMRLVGTRKEVLSEVINWERGVRKRLELVKQAKEVLGDF